MIAKRDKTLLLFLLFSSEYFQVKVLWSDGHTSLYDSEWLKSRAFSEMHRQKFKDLAEGPIKRPWKSKEMVDKLRNSPHQFHNVTRKPEQQLHWLEGNTIVLHKKYIYTEVSNRNF